MHFVLEYFMLIRIVKLLLHISFIMYLILNGAEYFNSPGKDMFYNLQLEIYL